MVQDPVVGAVIDQYRLDQKLGEGGMGSVWKATHLKIDKHVAMDAGEIHELH